MIPQAIVTGGNKGIGLHVAMRLLRRGYHVHVLSRTAPLDPPAGLQHHALDISNDQALYEVIESLPTPDILINNAGVMCASPWDTYSVADETRTLAVNLIAPMHLMQWIGRRMADAGTGRIVNVGSIAGDIGHPDIWYGATKAALLNATKSFAMMLGRSGVCVNIVAPGPVETDMLKAIPSERLQRIQQRMLSGRVLQADEVASAIEWLAIDSPITLNGACLPLYDGPR
ncbi:MAG: SDR family oxidoreductase [Myxococcota bacterium]|nr:SDR family oxidoreductase [Myxococcota bacterium]